MKKFLRKKIRQKKNKLNDRTVAMEKRTSSPEKRPADIPAVIAPAVLALGFMLRIDLIAYDAIQDKYFAVRYTDIDYDVYNDASRFIAAGASPYDRATYRYTPLLAELFLPDVLVIEWFGKVLFSVCDIIIAVLLYRILRSTETRFAAVGWMALWLFNPMSIVVSTRGNADVIVCLLVVLTFSFLHAPRIIPCSIAFGLAVHMKVPPRA